MITFELNQDSVPTENRLSSARLKKIAHALSVHLPAVTVGTVNVVFVDESEIRRLNRMYRDRDKTTDVLSFPSSDAELSGDLGDVIISFEVAKAQAEGDLELELVDLVTHGTLHVLGFDHEIPSEAETMFDLQDKIVATSL